MERQILHRLVIAGVTAGGVILALFIGFALFFHAAAVRSTVRLADRVDPARARLFIRTSDPAFLLEAIDRLGPFMGDSKPGPEQVTTGDLYELAVLESGSGGTAWILSIHQRNAGTHATIATNTDLHLLLPQSQRKRSLGYTPLFRRTRTSVEDNGQSAVWLRTSALSPAISQAQTLLLAAMDPVEEAMILWKTPREGTVLLSIKEMRDSLRRQTVASGLPENPLLLVDVSDPAAWLTLAAAAVYRRDRVLAEGISGIVKQELLTSVGSTDIPRALSTLLAGPVSIGVFGSDEGIRWIMLSSTDTFGRAKEMLSAVANRRAEGTVRRMQFFGRENARTDIAPQPIELEEIAARKEWTMLRIGSGGTALFAGLAGRRYALSNNLSLLETSIGTVETRGGEIGVLQGSVDLAWLQSVTEESDLPEISDLLLGADAAAFRWNAEPFSRGLQVDWTLTRTRP